MKCMLRSMVVVGLLSGCGTQGIELRESSGEAQVALSAVQQRVLGFETPLGDWAAAQGTLSASSTASQGGAALGVVPSGWTEIASIPLSSLGDVGGALSYQIRLPDAVPWGETRMVVQIPSRGVSWHELGSFNLANRQAGVYHRVEFALSPAIVEALESSYSDLVLRLVVNAPALGSPYLIDDIQVAAPGGGGGGSGGSGGTAGGDEIVVAFQLPQAGTLHGLSVIGQDVVDIEDRASVVEADGGFGMVANTGSGSVTAGVEAHIGSILSVGSVFLRDRTHVHGDVTTQGNFTTQNIWHVDGSVNQQQAVPVRTLSRRATFPVAAQLAVALEPGEQRTAPIAPGRYAGLMLKSGAAAPLVAGNYLFGSVDLEPGSTLNIDDSQGSVFVYVAQSLNVKGRILRVGGGQPRLLALYTGTGSAFVSAPFRGSLFAPNGGINLERVVPDRHEGTFLGKHVRIAPDTQVVHRPFPWLIEEISVDKPQVCSGESVRVTVRAGDPTNPGAAAEVFINDTRTSQYSDQFEGSPGPRLIAVSARAADGTMESATTQVEVIDCGPTAPIRPLLYAEENLYHPDTVNFTVRNALQYEAGTTYDWSFGDGASLQTHLAAVSHDYTAALGTTETSKVFDVSVTVTRPGTPSVIAQRTLLIWNTYALSKTRGSIEPPVELPDPNLVGDGTDLVGNAWIANREAVPLTFNQRRIDQLPCDTGAAVRHGSSQSLTVTVPANGQQLFNLRLPQSSLAADVCGVSVQLFGSTSGGQAVHASFKLDRPATLADSPPIVPQLSNILNYLVAQGLVANPRQVSEEEVMELYRQRRIPLTATEAPLQQAAAVPGEPCDPDNPGPPPGTGFSCQPTGEWHTDSADWSTAPDELVPQAHIANAMVGDLVLVRGCTGPVKAILGAVGQKYTHTGVMTKNLFEIRHSTFNESWLQKHANGVAGQPSDGFEEDALRYGWPGTISATIEQAFYRGKNVPSPEGTPFQIKGFQRSEVRCQGDSNIVYPRVLKPPPSFEVATRTLLAQAAQASRGIHGHYRFFSYSQAPDTAANDPNGPAPLLDDLGNPANYGAAPTVCSTFDRFAAKGAVAAVDSDKSFPLPSNVTGGPPDGIFFYSADMRRAAADVLYAELYNKVRREIAALEAQTDDFWWVGSAGGAVIGFVIGGPPGAARGAQIGAIPVDDVGDTLIEWATDAPDDVANQVVNCFASDFCSEDAKDSERWKQPGRGFAVSPDDLMNHYDSPATGGLYGYHERMIYRGKRYRPIFQWLPSPGTRTITGTVVTAGASGALEPVAEAAVRVLGFTDKLATTDAAGRFSIPAVPDGNLQIHAQKLMGPAPGVLNEGDSCYRPDSAQPEFMRHVSCTDFNALLDSELHEEVLIELIGPDPDFRKLTLTGNLRVEDCDCCAFETCPDVDNFTIFRTCLVSPLEREMSFSIPADELCEDEVGVSLTATCRLLDDNRTVRLSGSSSLFEAGSSSCGGGDEEHTRNFTVDVGPDSSAAVSMGGELFNSGFCTSPLGAPFDCDDEGRYSNLRAANTVAD